MPFSSRRAAGAWRALDPASSAAAGSTGSTAPQSSTTLAACTRRRCGPPAGARTGRIAWAGRPRAPAGPSRGLPRSAPPARAWRTADIVRRTHGDAAAVENGGVMWRTRWSRELSVGRRGGERRCDRVPRHPHAPARRQGPADPPGEVPRRAGRGARDHQGAGALPVRLAGRGVRADHRADARRPGDVQGRPGLHAGASSPAPSTRSRTSRAGSPCPPRCATTPG